MRTFFCIIYFCLLISQHAMSANQIFDVIVIGGSFSGLSAGLALGRSMRRTLIIDNNTRCNAKVVHSHNLLGHDGDSPESLIKTAKNQISKYESVKFYKGLATKGYKKDDHFVIETNSNETFSAKKIIFASGLKDKMPNIPGMEECWAVSVLHCPYCHGYEVRDKRTGIIGNGDIAMHYVKLIINWSKNLVLFTNGKSTLTDDQMVKIRSKGIDIIETDIDRIDHDNGMVKNVVLKDQTHVPIDAIYTRPLSEPSTDIPKQLDCEYTELGLVKVDMLQKTNIKGVYACGDITTMVRSLSTAISAGSFAGAAVNMELTSEEFESDN